MQFPNTGCLETLRQHVDGMQRLRDAFDSLIAQLFVVQSESAQCL